jgi:acetate kinase
VKNRRVRILVINCGSSSLKFDVVDVEADGDVSARPAHGELEPIGPDTRLRATAGGRSVERPVDGRDHTRAVHAAIGWLSEVEIDADHGLDAVGHRIVHGGARFIDATPVDDDVLRGIEEVTVLAPLHNGPALGALRAARDAFGTSVPMVAVFDTAFHAAMPARSAHYAIDPALATRHGVRRYGFHGLAHRSMLERVAVVAGADTAAARLVTLQLGNGCSAAAIEGGRSVDTSMGLTPLEGLVMGTRSGDADPSLAGFLARAEGVPVDEVDRWLNTRSGLLGVSGRSADMRVLLSAEARGDARAALAVEMFCYRARKYVGAYVAGLGGAEGIVFGGGIGEHAPEVRERILTGMAWAGVELDRAANAATVGGREGAISAPGSRAAVWAVHVDEASVAAGDVARVLTSR